jgi:hypothetical protein
MRRLIFLLFLVPLLAQDLRVIHLSRAEATALQALAKAKLEAEENWDQAQRFIRRKYLIEQGVAESGDVKTDAPSIKPGWESGFLFSQDYSVIAPKTKPCESEN